MPPPEAAHTAPAPATEDRRDDAQSHLEPVSLLEPNQTVYINNINEKIKEKDLKKAVSSIFAEHGKVRCLHMIGEFLIANCVYSYCKLSQ